MTFQNSFIYILNWALIIFALLCFSLLIDFLKKYLLIDLKNFSTRCFDIASNLYNIFIGKLTSFHKRLTDDYVTSLNARANKVLVANAMNTKMALVSKLSDTIERVDSFGRNVAVDIKDAVQSVNFKHTEQIQSSNLQLEDSLSKVSKITTPVKAVEVSVKGNLWAAIALSVAVLFFNTFLLSQFFSDMFGLNLPILKYPIRIELAHPLAMIFGMLEIACGWIYSHQVRKEETDEYAPMVGTYKFWILMGFTFLIIVELYSFAALSARVDIAKFLKIPEESILYTISTYFMAFFGLGLGIIEFMLGLYMSELSEKRSFEKVSNRSMDYVDRIKKQVQRVIDVMNPLSAKLSKFASTIDQIPDKTHEILKSFSGSDEAPSSIESLVTIQLSKIRQELKSDESNELLDPTTKQAVYRKIFVDIGVIVLWSILVYTIYQIFISSFQLPSVFDIHILHFSLIHIIALFLTATPILVGIDFGKLFQKHEELGEKKEKLSTKLLLGRVILFGVMIATTLLINYKNNDFIIALLMGILMPLAAYYISSLLYAAFSSFTYVIQLAYLLFIWVIQYLSRTILLNIIGMMLLMVWGVIVVVSAPGKVVREIIWRKSNV